MSRPFAICLGLGLLAACSRSPGDGAAEPGSPDRVAPAERATYREGSEEELDALVSTIREDLTGLSGEPAWAGVYAFGDGLGMNVGVRVSPAGMTYTWHGCLGLYDYNYGAVHEVDAAHVRVDWERDPGESLWELGTDWHHCTWGNYEFLVPEPQMLAFCNAANAGSWGLWDFPHRTRDGSPSPRGVFSILQPPPPGSPSVPSSYRSWLLPVPLSGTVLETLGTHELEDGASSSVCTVDLGSTDGLRVGMELYRLDPLSSSPVTTPGVVTEVGPETSRVRFQSASIGTRTPPALHPRAPASRPATRAASR